MKLIRYFLKKLQIHGHFAPAKVKMLIAAAKVLLQQSMNRFFKKSLRIEEMLHFLVQKV
jgi:hypothetical protein